MTESFSGIIDDVRIYSRALAAAEVQTLAQTTWTDSDIGAVGSVGSATIYNGVFTINGAGADIWNNADAFHYVYQKVSGDCVITAKVTSVQNVNAWSKVGVMIRETLDPGSAFADNCATPGNGIALPVAPSGWTTVAAIPPESDEPHAPCWCAWSRTGNVITAYGESPDGNTWTQIGSETFTMAANVFVGLCTALP